MRRTVALAFSGGLDTSVCVKWLQEKYDAEVITVTLDLGQKDDMGGIEERSRQIGARNHYTIDAKEEFVRDYVFPSVKANALYEEKYPLGTALGRPLIGKKLVEVAEKEGATAVAHGCTGKGNDQVRIDVTVRAMNPSLQVIAPVREWNMSRDEEIAYAQQRGLPVKPSKSIFSVDQNIWGRSVESGPLENPDTEPPEDAFEWTASPEEAPDEPGYLELGFQEGVPTRMDGKAMEPLELVSRVNEVAGAHGVGRIDHIEDRLVGIKSREVYECPAASVIIEAHRDLEKLVLTRHELAFKAQVEREWAWLVYSGLWLEPLRPALDRFIAATQHRVTGSVKVKLYKGGARVVGRSSDYSIYDVGLATYGRGSTFDQMSAVGFIELWGLQSRVASGLSAQSEEKEENGHQRDKAKEAQ
ncbi:MAG: argininosuccinate synthase [Nitrososphaerota archaeon]|nr:argininosuccinate synthase [Nitrososphaerota archaeon]MDG6919170.1 argininosuccinate synthase [Nitrososphaerota archaeon]MDG6920574.1 argininosuccinate synthase [Nitrososphaerota archaeon]MDG6924847.1 argininosuccinate synthase [Nitrososphaerota archaeon]MDG6937580.1 argininosuccinate synthase [Nitrososphaerota archaeon]